MSQENNPKAASLFTGALICLVAALFFAKQSISGETSPGETSQSQPGDTPVVGNLQTGGPFSLVDHTGMPVTDETYRSRFMLIYFGYTFCPDICPTGLQTMVQALELMGAAAARVQPIFISIDPERDTVEAMADYVGLFHPRLIGLTGTAGQVRQAARAYNVHYRRREYKGEILVGHTVNTYLTGPGGDYLMKFGHNTNSLKIATGILQRMNQAKSTSAKGGIQ